MNPAAGRRAYIPAAGRPAPAVRTTTPGRRALKDEHALVPAAGGGADARRMCRSASPALPRLSGSQQPYGHTVCAFGLCFSSSSRSRRFATKNGPSPCRRRLDSQKPKFWPFPRKPPWPSLGRMRACLKAAPPRALRHRREHLQGEEPRRRGRVDVRHVREDHAHLGPMPKLAPFHGAEARMSRRFMG